MLLDNIPRSMIRFQLHKPKFVRENETRKISEISEYKGLTLSRPENLTLCWLTIKKELPIYMGFDDQWKNL